MRTLGRGDTHTMSNETSRKHNPALTNNARSLRKNMTKEERHLWYDFLRSYRVRFLRQKVIDTFIADFYCHQARLVIELDGSQHYSPQGLLKEQIRTEKMEQRGLTVLHIPNNAVNQNFRGVCEYIDYLVQIAIGAEIPQSSALRETADDSPL